jgi:hypothetical protein
MMMSMPAACECMDFLKSVDKNGSGCEARAHGHA